MSGNAESSISNWEAKLDNRSNKQPKMFSLRWSKCWPWFTSFSCMAFESSNICIDESNLQMIFVFKMKRTKNSCRWGKTKQSKTAGQINQKINQHKKQTKASKKTNNGSLLQAIFNTQNNNSVWPIYRYSLKISIFQPMFCFGIFSQNWLSRFLTFWNFENRYRNRSCTTNIVLKGMQNSIYTNFFCCTFDSSIIS